MEGGNWEEEGQRLFGICKYVSMEVEYEYSSTYGMEHESKKGYSVDSGYDFPIRWIAVHMLFYYIAILVLYIYMRQICQLQMQMQYDSRLYCTALYCTALHGTSSTSCTSPNLPSLLPSYLRSNSTAATAMATAMRHFDTHTTMSTSPSVNAPVAYQSSHSEMSRTGHGTGSR